MGLSALASAAPRTLFARRTEPLPQYDGIEQVYFMPDHFKTQRVFVKVRATLDGNPHVYWHNILPRSVFYDRTDYCLYFERDDGSLLKLADGVKNHPFAPPGFLFQLQPTVELKLTENGATLSFDDEKLAPGPAIPGQGSEIPFP
jgi:hypothetical protein